MGSQKQSHRIRRYDAHKDYLERENANLYEHNKELVNQNLRLAQKLEHYENRPPIWKVAAYFKWKTSERDTLKATMQNWHKGGGGVGGSI